MFTKNFFEWFLNMGEMAERAEGAPAKGSMRSKSCIEGSNPSHRHFRFASLAQLDRVLGYEPEAVGGSNPPGCTIFQPHD